MCSKGKNLFDKDSDDDIGRKRKRLKKVSSNLFDNEEDDDDDFFDNEGKDKSLSKSVVEINDDDEVEEGNKNILEKKSLNKKASNKPVYYDITSYFKPSSKKIDVNSNNNSNNNNNNNSNNSNSNNSNSNNSNRNNSNSNNSNSNNRNSNNRNSNNSNSNNRNNNYSSNRNNSVMIKSSSNNSSKIPVKNVSEYFDLLEKDQKNVKGENAKPNLKRERGQEGEQDVDIIEEERYKKKLTSFGKNKTKMENNDTTQKFDYLPFNNLKFVLTGVFKNFSRDDLQSKIKEHGGSVMSAVSSKTHYLIHGEYLEDGRLYNEGRKYLKAFELQQKSNSIIKILNEEQLLELLPEGKSHPQYEEQYGTHNGDANKENSDKSEYQDFVKKQQSDYSTNYKSASDNYSSSNMLDKESRKDKHDNGLGNYNNEVDERNKLSNNKVLNQLWVEKYRPKNINELVGNNQNVLKLKNWLASWEDVCIRGMKKQVTKTFRGIYENVNARCALLSGAAGIGKTTTAKIISEASGYNVIEFNASDERNKAAIEKISEMATGGYSIASLKSRKLSKTCIIMDEVDGMSSGDKGGSAAILKLIEKTKCPIICICNDRQNSKMRTLANKCYDLKFTVPNKNAVVKRLLEICKKENIMMEPNALELLWETTVGDMRQMLNTLQLLSKTYKRIQFLDLKKELNNSNKNVQSLANPFEITLKLLNFHESSKLKVREIMDLFFVDYELIPYFISENYTNVFNDNDKSPNSINKWNAFAQISYDLALADKIKYNMKTTMDFSLLPHFSILSCVCPVMRIKLLKLFMSGRINFPSAFGKISTFNKNKRLLNELCFNISYKLNVCPKYMVTSGFLSYIYFKIMTPLLKNNINEAIELMEEYNITREMITEILPSLRLPNQENLYDKLDSKVKASFTRLYNSSHVIKNDPNSLRKGLTSTEKKSTFKINEYESDEDMDELSESKEDKDDDILVKSKIDRKPTIKNRSAAKPKAPSKNIKKR
ncbi:replication factor C subunit 1, putative [Plasmodium malariae]|uniref:Replication factor C subunit 1 n=1 Tax=Plasmodium malariae TaxID=5858 RepID=A0A1D3JJ80_PLAMA|nr:replication factor C subunit 1, putative [Plasmodium malariae]SBT86436.1 replication factor C subunit 1, putative [Plasmodium malariae]